MITLTNRIDMRPGVVPLVIHLGQYDSDFSLIFELYSSAGNFTVESGTTAMIRGTKTDGNAYDADATIDVSAKTVTVAGSEQMTAAKGRNVYELVLKKGTKVLSTANFILDVERAAMDADTIASESVLKELNAIIAGAETATEAAADAASAADRAEDAAESVSSASAQIATNTADIADLKADLSELDPGLSEAARAALLACFAKVAWTDEHGQDYYDALETALYPSVQNPFENAEYEVGAFGYNTNGDETGCVSPTELDTRARAEVPIRCTSGRLVATSDYEINMYMLNSTRWGEYYREAGADYVYGYNDMAYADKTLYSWGATKEILSGTKYVLVAVRKKSGEAFTSLEARNIYGVAFTYEEVQS